MATTVSDNVQKLLADKGWTPYKLGKLSGVSLTAVYNLNKRKRGHSSDTLVKIADALGVTVDELVRAKTAQNEQI